jgi:hypothetical protein
MFILTSPIGGKIYDVHFHNNRYCDIVLYHPFLQETKIFIL